MAGKFTWCNMAKHCWLMSKNFLFSNPAMFCLITSTKLSRQWFEFSLKVKVMGLNPNYLLKSFLLYLHIGKFWCQFGLIAPSSDWQLTCSVFWWHLPSTLFPFNLNTEKLLIEILFCVNMLSMPTLVSTNLCRTHFSSSCHLLGHLNSS